jgi:negative regulator of replication initiation
MTNKTDIVERMLAARNAAADSARGIAYESLRDEFRHGLQDDSHAVQSALAMYDTLRAQLAQRDEALERIISLLRATDELQANGFADDAVNLALAALTKGTPDDN